MTNFLLGYVTLTEAMTVSVEFTVCQLPYYIGVPVRLMFGAYLLYYCGVWSFAAFIWLRAILGLDAILVSVRHVGSSDILFLCIFVYL